MRSGWFELPNFSLRPKPEVVSCTLSGGGSRASFQIGALSYLYEHDPEFRPTQFVGTSAGAILAAGLSQYATTQEQAAWVDVFGDIWLGMQHADDMFTPREWYRKLQDEGPEWARIVQPSEPTTTKWTLTKPHANQALPDPVDDPVEAALAPDSELQPMEWSLHDVATIASNLGKLPRIGSDLSAIWAGLESTKSMYRPGPILKQLLNEDVFQAKRVRESGMTLRIALVALESGELHFMDEHGHLMDRSGRIFDDVERDLVLGILASCSIPGVFRAVPVGAETYVDGGTRENAPIELAMTALVGSRHYLISSQSNGVRKRASMIEASMFDVIMRSAEILIDEAGRDEAQWARTRQALVIDPSVDVHDVMTVEPALMQIFRDHGWIRAAEEVSGADQAVRAQHDKIIRKRVECASLERAYVAEPNNKAKAEITNAKLALKRLLASAESSLLPPGADSWWAKFEIPSVAADVWWLS